MTSRLALVSDIHGNLPALEAVLAELARERVDAVLNLGDIVSGPLWPRETAERLMALGWPTIAGNHERQLLARPAARLGPSDAFAAAALAGAQRAWLAALPATLAWSDEVFACHGTPASDLHYLLETVVPGDDGAAGGRGIRAATPAELGDRLGALAVPLVVCGHSHQPRVMQCGGTLVVNPGSVGLPAFDDTNIAPHRVECGSPHARWALVEGAGRCWHVQSRLTPYDWEAAARRAEANGRGDWADALRTGVVGRREGDLERRG